MGPFIATIRVYGQGSFDVGTSESCLEGRGMDVARLLGRSFGPYVLQALINEGRAAGVFKAHDLSTERDVALKVITVPDLARDTAVGWRFSREGQWLASCEDPHIVRVYGTGMVEGFPYIAMELLPRTLAELVRHQPLSLDALIEAGAGILLGLAAAHRAGVIHGDLKPANVGVDARGVIKLLDFGAAMPLPWHADAGACVTELLPFGRFGTLQYMAPEQLLGRSMDERTDVYGAGAVLYELSTGRRPFDLDPPAALVGAILHRRVQSPSCLNPRVSACFDAVVRRALAKNPASRFRTVLAMMDALLAVRGSDPDSCREPDGTRVSSEQSPPLSDGTWGFDWTVRSGIDTTPARAGAIG
jgi:serine/threonine-protein kinase